MTAGPWIFTEADSALVHDLEDPWDTDESTLVDGTPLRVATATLRFHAPETLNPFLAEAGFRVESQYGDQRRGPLTAASR